MIASTYLIYIKNNKILLSERYQTGYQDGNYGLPSGHVEDNETLTQSLIREVDEEINIKLNSLAVKLVHIMHRKEADIRIDFFFICTNLKTMPINNEPDKCGRITWFSLDKLPDNIVWYIKIAIDNYQKGIFYSEAGWK
jgi:8-oxo-dGTP diphosphatase